MLAIERLTTLKPNIFYNIEWETPSSFPAVLVLADFLAG
jgi:hypothetical protein